jgi:hypothetical protein
MVLDLEYEEMKKNLPHHWTHNASPGKSYSLIPAQNRTSMLSL